MGFVATATPDMQDWSVETLTDGFVLQCDRADAVIVDMPATPGSHSPSLTFSTSDIPAIRAALDQVERIAGRGQRYEWARVGEVGDLEPVPAIEPPNQVSVRAFGTQELMSLLSRKGELADHEELRGLVLSMVEDVAESTDLVSTETAEEFVRLAAETWGDPGSAPSCVGALWWRLSTNMAEDLARWREQAAAVLAPAGELVPS